MDTQLRTVARETNQRPGRGRAAAAFTAAVVVVVAAVAGVAMLASNSDGKPVAAADALPEITFDGTACAYEGPSVIERGSVDFVITNATDSEFAATAWRLEEPAFGPALEGFPVGSDGAVVTGDPLPDGVRWFLFPAGARESARQSSSMSPGNYVIDCATLIDGEADHVWRAATIEIVAP